MPPRLAGIRAPGRRAAPSLGEIGPGQPGFTTSNSTQRRPRWRSSRPDGGCHVRELVAIAAAAERLDPPAEQLVPRDEVDVEVEDELPRGPAVVPPHVEAAGVEGRGDLALDHLDHPEQLADHRVVELEERRRVHARDDEHVPARRGVRVEERHRGGRLVHDLGRRVLRGDPAEQALAHAPLPWPDGHRTWSMVTTSTSPAQPYSAGITFAGGWRRRSSATFSVPAR